MIHILYVLIHLLFIVMLTVTKSSLAASCSKISTGEGEGGRKKC